MITMKIRIHTELSNTTGAGGIDGNVLTGGSIGRTSVLLRIRSGAGGAGRAGGIFLPRDTPGRGGGRTPPIIMCGGLGGFKG